MEMLIKLPQTLKDSIARGVLSAQSLVTFLVVDKGFRSRKDKFSESSLSDLSYQGKHITECKIDKWEGNVHLKLS